MLFFECVVLFDDLDVAEEASGKLGFNQFLRYLAMGAVCSI